MGTREQESRQPNGVLSFTLFVILPTEDVCSLRNLTSGVTVRELRCRLELMAGIPAQIYRLVCSDDVALHEEHQLVLEKNVWDGFIIRIQLHDSWTKLYKAVLADDVDYVVHHGAVHFHNQKVATPEEETKFKDIMRERGFVALFIASYYGHVKLCQVLLSLGVDANTRTPFHRTPLHAAVCRDQEKVMDVLIQHGGSIDVKDAVGDSVEIVARKCFAKQCVRKLRIMKLQGSPPNGCVSLNGSNSSANRKIKVSFNPSPPETQTASRPNTSSRGRLVKRHTVAAVSSKTLPLPVGGEEVTSSHQHFMWDTDNPGRRSASATRFRFGTPSSSFDVMPRIGTANSKHSVSWDDSTPRSPSRHTPSRFSSLPNQQSILKNKGDNWATVPPRKSVSRDSSNQGMIHVPSPPRAPSEHGSQLSIASAPGMGQDVSGNNSDTRSVESAPEMPAQSSGDTSSGSRPGTSRKESAKRPRTRLLVSRHRTTESWRTMKRRIQMAESKKKVTEEEKQKKRETFEEWLNRKRKQDKRDSRETDSDESGPDSDNDGSNPQAFKQWLKEQRERQITRPQTVTVADLYRRQTRPLKGLVTVTDPPDVNIDNNENMVAHKKWREKYNNVGEYEQTRDISAQKKKLEEKRQKLLARAVSYDEWMEHTEDRKLLMKQILQANLSELERIENEKLKKRTSRQVSYTQWREKVEKQDAAERMRKERLRIQKEEENNRNGEFRSSACVPHDVWLKRKEEERRQRQEKEKENTRKAKVKGGDNSSAFDAWLDKKHEQDLFEIQCQIKKERDMIKLLRDRRMTSVSTC